MAHSTTDKTRGSHDDFAPHVNTSPRTYPTFQQALTPTNETVTFIADSKGKPQLRFDADRDCFIRVLPVDADLEQLGKHPNWEIREAVALDARTDEKLLHRLAKDHQEEVSNAAKSNPNYVPSESVREYVYSAEIDRKFKALDTAWKYGQWGVVIRRWSEMVELAADLSAQHDEAIVFNACFDWIHASIKIKMDMHALGARQLRTVSTAAMTGYGFISTFGVSSDSYWETVVRMANEAGCENGTLDAMVTLWLHTGGDDNASHSVQHGSLVSA